MDDAAARMRNELHGLRRRLPEVFGVVLASADGMPVMSDAPTVDADSIAAMAATNLGLGRQFAQMVGQGPLRDSVLRARDGMVVTCPAGRRALLAVLARGEVDPAKLHAECRATAERIGILYERPSGLDERLSGLDERPGGNGAPSAPTRVDGCTPRSTRSNTQPSTGLPGRHPIMRPPTHR